MAFLHLSTGVRCFWKARVWIFVRTAINFNVNIPSPLTTNAESIPKIGMAVKSSKTVSTFGCEC
jgi:hypothetical protein